MQVRAFERYIPLMIYIPKTQPIKAVFAAENYVPQPQIESSRLLTLYCVTMIQAKIYQIISRESMSKHNFGQTLNLKSAVVTLNRSGSSKFNLELFCVCLQTKYNCIYASSVESNPLVQKT